MLVYTVMPAEQGNVVLLSDLGETVFVPIFIGDSEALVISLRLTDQAFVRPLTHDLLDAVLRELGAELVEVRIDSLQDSAFVATVQIRRDSSLIMLDSRASDGIALALGNEAPIYVSRDVIAETGLLASDLWLLDPTAPDSGPSPSELLPPKDVFDL